MGFHRLGRARVCLAPEPRPEILRESLKTAVPVVVFSKILCLMTRNYVCLPLCRVSLLGVPRPEWEPAGRPVSRRLAQR